MHAPSNMKLQSAPMCNLAAIKATWATIQRRVFACHVSGMRGTTSRFESFCQENRLILTLNHRSAPISTASIAMKIVAYGVFDSLKGLQARMNFRIWQTRKKIRCRQKGSRLCMPCCSAKGTKLKFANSNWQIFVVLVGSPTRLALGETVIF